MMLYLLKIVCILLITTTFAWGNIERTYSKEKALEPMINEICERLDIDVNLVKAIIRVESCFEPHVVSKDGDQKGLMQLSKTTAKRFGVKNVFDPYENIMGGVKYLKHLESIFGNDLVRILASYNVGEGKIYKKKIPPAGQKYATLVLNFKSKYDKRNI